MAGHQGVIRSVRIGDTDRRALVFGTRTHYYEGKGVRAVVHGVRTAAKAGCSTVVLTNGCGGLNPAWSPGTPVLIRDHLNLTATSPLEGATFVDLTDLYSSRLRALCREVEPDLDEGVYVQFPGPHYETPAEVQMAKVLGGDLVGMSTTLEAIAARHAGLEVLGVSLVTNLAAGISDQPLDHAEVLEAGRAAAAALRADARRRGPEDLMSAPVRRRRRLAGRRPGPGRPAPSWPRCWLRPSAATRRRWPTWPTGSTAPWSSARPGCAAPSGAGLEPDEPRPW